MKYSRHTVSVFAILAALTLSFSTSASDPGSSALLTEETAAFETEMQPADVDENDAASSADETGSGQDLLMEDLLTDSVQMPEAAESDLAAGSGTSDDLTDSLPVIDDSPLPDVSDEYSLSAESAAPAEETTENADDGSDAGIITVFGSAEEDTAINASSSSGTRQGSCGTNATYSYDETTHILTISGTGRLNFVEDYISPVSSIVITSGITEIGSWAFQMCGDAQEIQLPDTLQTVDADAFRGCQNITKLTLPSGTKSIGTDAFNDCPMLEEIVIPERVTQISENSFNFSNNVTIAGYTYSLAEFYAKGRYIPFRSIGTAAPVVIVSEQIDGSSVSWECDTAGLLTIRGTGDIPNNSSMPWQNGYYFNIVKHLVIEEGITAIPEYAFHGMSELIEVDLPASLSSIGQCAFGSCTSMQKVLFRGNDTRFPETGYGMVFDSCPPTLEIHANTYTYAYYYAKQNNILFVSTGTAPSIPILESQSYGPSHSWTLDMEGTLILRGIGDMPEKGEIPISPQPHYDCPVRKVIVEDTVTSLPNSLFHGNVMSELESVSLGNGVTKIGSNTFWECTNLREVQTGSALKSIGDSAFAQCQSLETISLPSGLTSIGIGGFEGCTSLKNLTLPDSVTTIGNRAFYRCTSLQSVHLPDNLTQISEETFFGCESLHTVTGPAGYLQRIYNNAFAGCSSLSSFPFPDSLLLIQNGAFARTGLVSVTIPASVTKIEACAFNLCNSLKEFRVDAGNQYYTSQSGVLYSKNNQTLLCYPGGLGGSFSVPAGTTQIETSAFEGNENITDITIPDGLTYISSSAFQGCSSLRSIVFPDSLSSIDSSAFKGCSSLASVTLPQELTYIGSYAFSDTAIKTVSIPARTDVFYHAFGYISDAPVNDFKITGFFETPAETYARDNGFVFDGSKQPNSIQLSSASYNCYASEDGREIYCIGAASSSGKIVYTSSNSKISVAADGMVTIPAGFSGTAVITVSSPETGGYLAAAARKFTLTVWKNANYLQLRKDSATLDASPSKTQTRRIYAHATGGSIKYSSSNSKIKVDANGKVIIPANFSGTVKITVRAPGNSIYKAAASRTFTLTVKRIANSITASSVVKTAAAAQKTYSWSVKQKGKGKLTIKSSTTKVKVTAGKITVAAGFSGQAKITITAAAAGAYNKATKTVTITAKPSAPTLSAVTSPKAGNVKFTWKKNVTAAGYELQYAYNKAFSSGLKKVTIPKNTTVSKQVTGLKKGKTCFARIRSYKTIAGKKYYSGWSTVKSVKVK